MLYLHLRSADSAVCVTHTVGMWSGRTAPRGTACCVVQASRPRVVVGWAESAHIRARSRTMRAFADWPTESRRNRQRGLARGAAWLAPRVRDPAVEQGRSPKRVPLRSLPHPPAANPLGSRWRGDLAAIAWPSSDPPFSASTRGGDSRNIQTNDNGATEVTPPREALNGRKRRGSVPHLLSVQTEPSRIPFPDLRTEPSLHPRWSSRRDASSRPRYHARARKLTLEHESTIRTLAGTKSLRSLAAEFGVSHETIRPVLRQVPAD